MKIIIDIGHPAHVHYFKNMIKIMESKGHEFLIVAKDRNVTYELLDLYDIKFKKRKNYPKHILGKLVNIPVTDALIVYYCLKFKPDLLIGFSGTHIAHAGKFLNIPSIVLDDTEHAKWAHASYKSFAKNILTPACFGKDLGLHHYKFEGYMELCYMHPNYFQPDKNIWNFIGLNPKEKYIILRFVSWNASHDIGQSGLDIETKYKLVNELSKEYRVFISAEGELPVDLKKYQIQIPANKMHDVLYHANLFIGEGATMASECACVGTPAIYVNSLELGYCTEQEQKYGLVFGFRNGEGVLEKAKSILDDENSEQIFKVRKEKMLQDKIDVTAFLIWFAENYPQSIKKLEKKVVLSRSQFSRITKANSI